MLFGSEAGTKLLPYAPNKGVIVSGPRHSAGHVLNGTGKVPEGVADLHERRDVLGSQVPGRAVRFDRDSEARYAENGPGDAQEPVNGSEVP
jgi:hypothetical protein